MVSVRAVALPLLAVLGMSANVEAKPISFVCELPTQKLTLTFVVEEKALDSKQIEQGVLVGNAGTSNVLVVRGSYAVTFLEILATGVVQTTTVNLSKLEAIHSRHTLMSGEEFIPSQSKGTCTVRD